MTVIRYDEFLRSLGPNVHPVGYLIRGDSFSTGTTPTAAYEALKTIINCDVNPIGVASSGMHQCDICQFDGPFGKSTDVWIPHGSTMFVCPSLITHYIAAHRFLPPSNFLDAALACPDMQSMEYKKSFLAAGGSEIRKQFAAQM